MKINSLYIEAFGGIKGLRLDFSDRFNVIYGENENGKTTVMNFIKMMFYGSGRASQNLSGNIRKKYTPWDGSQMSGSIDFEHGGKKYRLEREFRTSNSTDRAVLCDLAFGERQTVAADVGNSFFGLSLPAFERSVFIGQFGFPEADAGAEGELNSKLSNIALTGDGDISFETVNSRLQKAKLSLMSKSGKAGEYDKNLKLLSEYKESLSKSREEMNLLSESKARVKELKAEILSLKAKADSYKSKIDSEQDVRNAQKLVELISLKERLDSLSRELALADGSVLDEMYISKLRFCISKTESAKAKAESKLAEIETLTKSIEEGLNPPEDANEETARALESEIALLEESIGKSRYEELRREIDGYKYGNPSFPAGKILIVIGIVLFAAGIISGAVLKTVPLFAVSAAGAILGAIGIISSASRKKKAELEKSRISELEARAAAVLKQTETEKQAVFDKKIKLEKIKTALNTTAAVIENQQKMLESLKSEYETLYDGYAKEHSSLKEAFSLYDENADCDRAEQLLPELSDKARILKELKQRINYLVKDLGGISYEQAKEKLSSLEASSLSGEDFEKLKSEYETAVSEISELSAEAAAITASVSAKADSIQNPEELRSKIAETEAKLASQKRFCDACDIASAVLSESFAEVRESYGSRLETEAAQILKKLSGGKYGSMSISKDLKVGVSETGSAINREADYLSSGTEDQTYLSLRLALSKLICEESEPLPLLLDDSLSQYDDSRTETALEFLKEYSESNQIIMFTCHGAVADGAKTHGADVKTVG